MCILRRGRNVVFSHVVAGQPRAVSANLMIATISQEGERARSAFVAWPLWFSQILNRLKHLHLLVVPACVLDMGRLYSEMFPNTHGTR